MKPSSTIEFAFVTDVYENQTRMRSNCRVQASILRVMHDSDDSFCDVKLFGVPPTGMQPRLADSLRPLRAHKSVLACASKHLRDLLTSEDYTDSNLSEYHIENIEHENLRRIVEFIYTDQLMMTTEDTVDEMCRVLTGAKYLVMENLADACETFLAGDAQIKLENCIKLWFFARKYSCLTLLHAISTFIASDLANAKEDAEFLRMPFDDCAKLLLCEAMITADADERCLAAIAWLTHDTVGRASLVSDIFNMIPLSAETISLKTISAVHRCEMLRKNAPDAVRKLIDVLLQQLITQSLPNSGLSGGSFGPNNNVPSKWYVIGGENTQRLFMQYDVRHRLWSHLPTLPWEREDFGACVVDGRIVAMGGYKNSDITNDIDEYDLSTKTWTASGVKLRKARKYLAVCSDAQEHAYAIGGDVQDGSQCSVFEKYNCTSKQIEKLDDIDLDRSRFTSAFANDRIYVAGGFHYDENIEVYDISTSKWSNIGSLRDGQWDYAGVIAGDDFYIMGGNEQYSDISVDTVQVFNIRTAQSFRSCSPLRQARSMCCATTLENGNVICVVGGKAVNKALNTVECFDKREGKWTMGTIVPNMPKRVFSFGFAVR